jgi:hypothetical protein
MGNSAINFEKISAEDQSEKWLSTKIDEEHMKVNNKKMRNLTNNDPSPEYTPY